MRPATRLYLILPPLTDAAQFKPVLAAALAAGEVACVLTPESARMDIKPIAQKLIPMAHERDVAFLIAGDPRLATRTGADGVHVAYAPDVIANAVSSLGTDAIVGAGALTTRDDAMAAGEAGASYVMFGEPNADGARPAAEQTLERVAWWAEIFNVPCVGYAGSLDEIGPLAEAGAEFVALGDAVWQHDSGPADAIKRANAILANTTMTA
jgi:thiamine-phosphate pyrophosphorylase